MQLRHLRALLAVVENGSIRGGARRIGLSQPALSRSIRELEEELAVPLIQRSGRGVIPTEYGRALVARVTVVDQELHRAKEEIEQLRGVKGGNVAVGLSVVASFLMASEAFARFWRAHSAARVRVIDGVFDLVLVGIREGRVDFSIGPLPQRQIGPGIDVEPLFRNTNVPVVRKGHPLAKARSLADLQKADWVLIGNEANSPELIINNFLDHGLKPPRVAVTSESFPALLELIVGTDLVSILPLQLLQHRFVRDFLHPVQIDEDLRSTAMALVRRAGVPLTPVANALAQEFRRLSRRYAKPDNRS